MAGNHLSVDPIVSPSTQVGKPDDIEPIRGPGLHLIALTANELQQSREHLPVILEEDGPRSQSCSEEDSEDFDFSPANIAPQTEKDQRGNKDTCIEMSLLDAEDESESFQQRRSTGDKFSYIDRFRNRSHTAPNPRVNGTRMNDESNKDNRKSRKSWMQKSFQKLRNVLRSDLSTSYDAYVKKPGANTIENTRSKALRGCFDFACSGPSKYRIKKAILGFIFGILLVVGIFVAANFIQYDFEKNKGVKPPANWTYGAGAAFAILLGLGLTFCYGLRCIILLMLPALFTTRGRAVILALIIQLLLIGPIKNTTENGRLVGETTSCQIQLLANQTDKLLKTLVNQTESVVDGYKALLNASLNTIVDNIKDNLKKINDIVKPLGIIDYTLQIHGVNVSRRDFESYSNEINFSRYYESPAVSSNKSFTALIEELENHFTSRIKYIEKFVSILRQVIPWSILLVFIQSFLYRRGYMSQIEYDNIYITKQFKILDAERKKKKVPTATLR